ncbi:beta-ketoacyl-[acyl-carrier-protein] synthase family protein [Saccharothrix sp. Mg75]|uniref:beta-ketoacyl-[acyl-carrier-protein] synthase family protein n=1 Tax=Saccharothrix sp. Mg75 TaxID=3445357 RepID=UPI003EED8050
MSTAERVVVTGLGVVSNIGTGAAGFTEGLRAGRSEVGPVTAFDTTGFDHVNACEVPDFRPERWISRVPAAELGRASGFAVAAARMAVSDAGLADADLRDRRGQVAIGTTNGEGADLDRLGAQFVAGGPEAMDPVLAGRVGVDRLAASVAGELGLWDVEAVVFTTACAAGNYAIGSGFDAIRSGDADYALVGGADAVCLQSFASFYRLGIIAPDRCRPFDADRQGILNGEGAGVLLLESLTAARARGARIHAEVLGYGLNCDAAHPTLPDQGGVEVCIALALADAGVRPEEVDLVSAHGTGTKFNDVTEARAIRAAFGDHPPRTIGLKSMLGHAMGAAAALGAVAGTIAITGGFIPPTANHRRTDPECRIDCVPNESVPAEVRVVQNNSFAFNGNNAIVVLTRYEEHT